MYWPLFGAFAASLLISWILTLCYARLAPRLGLIDIPDERKLHKHATPTGAGLAFVASTVICAGLLSAVFGLDAVSWNEQFLIGSLIMLSVLIDDRRSLSWPIRLAVHVLAGVAAMNVAFAGQSWQFTVLGAAWITVLVNALNFVDNMDGLCATMALIIAGCLAVAQAGLSDVFEPIPSHRNVGVNPWHLALLMGALAGFLPFNLAPARVFMGDAGSTFLGFFLGIATLPLLFDVRQGPRLSEHWLAPVCMMAIPIYDLASVALLRVWHARGLFVSDRNNLSHRLIRLGLSPARAVAVIDLMTLASGLGGLLLYQLSGAAADIAGLVQLACWWCVLPAVEFHLAYRR